MTRPEVSVAAAPEGEVTVLVCSSCRRADDPEAELRPGSLLAADARRAAAGTGVLVRHVACLGNCRRGLSAAIFRTGSWSYVFGGLGPESGADLVAGARLFATSTDGFMPFRARPESLKRGLVARIPNPDILKELPMGDLSRNDLTRVPCTVVTGFLGAGKTTLVRHVLENAGGRRFAVIVNEFGDVGIDGEIFRSCGIEGCSEENIVELANGCICCTVADDFVPALDRILSLEPRVDHIVIETSGLALPKPLVQAFQWPGVKSRVTVDSVVAVVDGVALAEGRVAQDLDALAAQRGADPSLEHDDPVEEVFGDQVACADLVVLTKGDLLDAAALAAARERVEARLGAAAKVVAVERGRIEPAALLGLGMAVEEVIDGRRTLHDGMLDHEHDDFDSFVAELAAVASPEALAERMRAAVEAAGVLRVKGFAEVAGKPMRLLVQAVGPRVVTSYDRAWAPGEAKGTRLVVIGLKGLDRGAVEEILGAVPVG